MLITILGVTFPFCAAQEVFLVKRTGQTVETVDASNADSISNILSEELTLRVSPAEVNVSKDGGTIPLYVESNTVWVDKSTEKWTSQDPERGRGTRVCNLIVNPSITGCDSTSIVVFTAFGDLRAEVRVNRQGSQGCPDRIKYGPDVSDCEGHTYPTVWIGTQLWMAENLQCTTYDTESERAGVTLPLYTVINVQQEETKRYRPFCADGRDAVTLYSGNLTEEQRKKLGLYYNWPAAAGLTDYWSQNTNGQTQGICPNGWHLPSKQEYETLGNHLDCNNGFTNGGKMLKSTTGWYDGVNASAGTDCYGFNALPAGTFGYLDGDDYTQLPINVGYNTFFWTATGFNVVTGNSNYRFLSYASDIFGANASLKLIGRSVRCVKNQ